MVARRATIPDLAESCGDAILFPLGRPFHYRARLPRLATSRGVDMRDGCQRRTLASGSVPEPPDMVARRATNPDLTDLGRRRNTRRHLRPVLTTIKT